MVVEGYTRSKLITTAIYVNYQRAVSVGQGARRILDRVAWLLGSSRWYALRVVLRTSSGLRPTSSHILLFCILFRFVQRVIRIQQVFPFPLPRFAGQLRDSVLAGLARY